MTREKGHVKGYKGERYSVPDGIRVIPGGNVIPSGTAFVGGIGQ